MTTTASAPATPGAPPIRECDVSARSTDIFGRVLLSARNHHFIVDGPAYNNCPGEALTPMEAFLSGVAACGVELIHVLAREQSIPLSRVELEIHGIVDRAKQARPGVTTFNTVTLDVTLWGANAANAATLIEGFKGRCPLFGTVSVATPDVQVRYTLGT
ncbi:MAG: OsmC family protein [Gemmatimonadaceae bacterium]